MGCFLLSEVMVPVRQAEIFRRVFANNDASGRSPATVARRCAIRKAICAGTADHSGYMLQPKALWRI